jgi:hypothetical protein
LYVKGKLKDDYTGPGAGEEIMIKALDFTSKGDDEDVTILYGGSKEIQVKKKFLEPTELFETGVYNSETDTNINPKTDENKPDAVGAVVDRLSERLKEITSSLEEMRVFVKDNSSLSHDSLDKCINELGSYLKNLEDEVKNGTSAIVN